MFHSHGSGTGQGSDVVELLERQRQAGAEREPYEEGFGAYASGAGLLDNPYHGDNCAHQQWANGWSQARDESQRQTRQ